MISSVENFTLNGFNLADEFNDAEDTQNRYFIVNEVSGRDSMSPELTVLTPTLVDGGYASHRRLQPRVINAIITIKGRTFDDMHKRVERLIEILNTEGKDVEIIFDDEPDRKYYGQVTDMEEQEASNRILKVSLTILCVDPYKYGETIESTHEGSDIVLANMGRAKTPPTFKMIAKSKSTFAMVADEYDNFTMIGAPSDMDVEVVDTRTTVLTERGDTLASWTDVGTQTDSHASKVQGKMGSDGTGITVLSYGSNPSASTSWYGPALIKEIAPIQNFEIEMRLRAESSRPSSVYRIEFYMFDENMVSLGKMAIWQNSFTKVQYVAEGRVGPFIGTGKNYLISSKNYRYDAKHFHGMIRLRRVGKRFDFYVARTRRGEGETGKHSEIYKATFYDADNQYQGKLKYVQMHIGTHNKGTKITLPRINNFKVTELNKLEVDETPYIVYPGDKIEFNSKTEEVFVNGEERSDLLGFGSEYLELRKGGNYFGVMPEDEFDVETIYTERFL